MTLWQKLGRLLFRSLCVFLSIVSFLTYTASLQTLVEISPQYWYRTFRECDRITMHALVRVVICKHYYVSDIPSSSKIYVMLLRTSRIVVLGAWHCISECVNVGSDDTDQATEITGQQTQVDMMTSSMYPARTCFTACADVQSVRNVRSCISQHCNWNVDTAASSNLAKRWGNRICMATHCRTWQANIERYFSCGLQHCS